MCFCAQFKKKNLDASVTKKKATKKEKGTERKLDVHDSNNNCRVVVCSPCITANTQTQRKGKGNVSDF